MASIPVQSQGVRDQDKRQKKALFNREVKQIMYGFGDVKAPLPESVSLMEDLVYDYITEMTKKALEVSKKRGKLQTEDIVFLIRKDRKKYARVKELLSLQEDISRASRAFELDGEKLP